MPSIQNWGVGINAAVPQERPVPANVFHVPGIAFHNQDFFLVRGCFGKNLAKGIADEGMSPELESTLRSAFEANAIHRRDEYTVGDGMRTLDGSPGIELGHAEFLLLRGMPANRRGIK